MKRAAHIVVAIGVAAVFAASVQSCIARRSEPAQYPTFTGMPSPPGDIRVLLAKAKECKVSVNGGYTVVAGGTTVLSSPRRMPELIVTANDSGIVMGARNIGHDRVEVIPAADGSLRVNGKAYRGRLVLIGRKGPRNDRRLLAVNVLPLDSYLAGVVSSEMHSYWPMPALRAQAIASRTYALYRAANRSGWDYDVAAGTGDQVYDGVAGETASARRAVRQTRGVVLLYKWKFLPAYYHSVCGGRTAGRRAVFGEPDITPLAGVDCKYCDPKLHRRRNSEFYRWQAAVPEAKVVRGLMARGRKVDGIEAIEPVQPDPGGHAREVTVTPLSGRPFTLTVSELRLLAGYGKLKSNCFECRKRGDTLVFQGRGFGHGVGMCQWGAMGMAISGYDSKAILEYYYPGADIRRVY